MIKCSACDTLISVNAHTSKSYCKNCKAEKCITRRNKEFETRKCVECNRQFKVRKYALTRFCNTKCWSNSTRKYKDAFILYREKCQFKFDVIDLPDKFDIDLLNKYGWYQPSNRGNNLNGVSRDHMLSVKDGFMQNVDSKLMSHPANCRLIIHRDNQRKRTKSCITKEDLIKRIENWNFTGN